MHVTGYSCVHLCAKNYRHQFRTESLLSGQNEVHGHEIARLWKWLDLYTRWGIKNMCPSYRYNNFAKLYHPMIIVGITMHTRIPCHLPVWHSLHNWNLRTSLSDLKRFLILTSLGIHHGEFALMHVSKPKESIVWQAVLLYNAYLLISRIIYW